MHADTLNGKYQAHMNVLEVRNGVGKKTVIDILPSGRRRKTVKALTGKEVEAIRRRQFIPDLFSGMLAGLRAPSAESVGPNKPGAVAVRKTRKNKKTRNQ